MTTRESKEEEEENSKSDNLNLTKSTKLNRLEPSRRSLSTPAVDLVAAIRTDECETETETDNFNESKKKKSGDGNINKEDKNKNKSKKQEQGTSWRRRTALGLIQFGPFNWLSSSSQEKSEHESCNKRVARSSRFKARSSNIINHSSQADTTTTTTTTARNSINELEDMNENGNENGNGNGNEEKENEDEELNDDINLIMNQTNNKATSQIKKKKGGKFEVEIEFTKIVGQNKKIFNFFEQSQSDNIKQQQIGLSKLVDTQRIKIKSNNNIKEIEFDSGLRSGQLQGEMPCKENATNSNSNSNTNNNNSNSNNINGQELIERLIDSESEWRQLIGEANGGANALSQLSELQIKRQEVIHELILTERHHCLTLALMRQVYLSGLRRLNELRAASSSGSGSSSGIINLGVGLTVGNNANVSDQINGEQIDLERLFPALDDLIQAHELFFAHLRLRLVECCSKEQADKGGLVGLVGPLGDLLISQFRLTVDNNKQENNKQTNSNNNNSSLQQQQQHQESLCSNRLSALQSEQLKYGNNKCTPTTTATATTNSMSLSNNTKQQNGNGQKLLAAYGKFCGQQQDSTRYYKYLMQHDRGFKSFIETQLERLSAIENVDHQHQYQQQQQHQQQGTKSNGKGAPVSPRKTLWRQRGIPECNLLVAQRLTKYPLLIEQLIKSSKDDPSEEEKLRQALSECRKLLNELNGQLARKESFERLLDIYAQFSPKSYTIYNRRLKFTKHNLLQHKRLRQLIHLDDQIRLWSKNRRKLFQVTCLILNDLVVFLRVDQNQTNHSVNIGANSNLGSNQQLAANSSNGQTNSTVGGLIVSNSVHGHHNQMLVPLYDSCEPNYGSNLRYYFANIDNKSSVISLSKLLVREKAEINEANEPRVYLLSNSPHHPEMYELAFTSKRHQTTFVQKLKSCIEARQKEQLERHQRASQAADFILACPRVMRPPLSLSGGEEDDGYVGINELDCFEDYAELNDYELEQYEQHGSLGNLPLDLETDSSILCHNLNEQLRLSHQPQLTASRKVIGNDQIGTDQFDFDIEQDIISDPVEDQSEQNSANRRAKGAQLPARDAILSTDEEPDEGSKLKGESDSQKAINHRQAFISSSSISEEAKSGNPTNKEDEESDGNCLASNESGLSELARDSMDESAASGRPRVKANQRRRRLQRPRNVSNQSSSSSEPSTSNRQSMGKQGSTDCVQNDVAEMEENDDSGRGIDMDSSASSSVDSSAVRNATELRSSASMAEGLCQTDSGHRCAISKDSLSLSSPMASLSKSNGSLASIKQSPKQLAAFFHLDSKQPSVCLSKQRAESDAKSQKQPKDRKLSSVSSFSSQVKLFNRLRSSGCSARQKHVNSHHMTTGAPVCIQCASSVGYPALTMRPQRRSSLFFPEQKLEELRDVQIQLDKDKQEWQIKFERMQEQLMNERRELDIARERLKQDRQQVANEREQLYRKLDLLKEKGIFLSPSHKVHIMTNQQQQQMQHSSTQNQTISCIPVESSTSSFRLTNGSRLMEQTNGSCSYLRLPQPNPPSISGSCLRIDGHNNGSRVVIDHESSLRWQNQSHNVNQNLTNTTIQVSPTVLGMPTHLSESHGQTQNTSHQPTSQTKVSHCLGLTSRLPLLSALSGSLLGTTK